MPIIKSAKKRVIQTKKRRAKNVTRKSAIKTAVKEVLEAVDANNLTQAQALLKETEAQLARAKSKRVMHRNTAARKISRIAKKVAQLKKSTQGVATR